MKNPYNSKRVGKSLTTPQAAKASNYKQVRAKVQSISKQIDRVRKQIERLEAKTPYSPALQRAKQFMAMNKIDKISQTRYIQTTQQYQEYKRFLDKFEKYETHSVKGAREAEQKKLSSLEDIMRQNGWDPDKYDVNALYDRLNKIDIYQVMTDFAITSGKIIASVTHIMNTKQGKRVTAQQLLEEVFGSMPAADKSGVKLSKNKLSSYNKNTKAYKKRKGKV